jgi:hypothetical protein
MAAEFGSTPNQEADVDDKNDEGDSGTGYDEELLGVEGGRISRL